MAARFGQLDPGLRAAAPRLARDGSFLLRRPVSANMSHCDILPRDRLKMPKTTRTKTSSDRELSNVAVEILLTLQKGARHGYAIKLDVEERIGDDFVLGSGSLYQGLQRLERRGYIAETKDQKPRDARRGRVYRIEPAGKRALESELSRMTRVLKFARRRPAEAR